MVVIAEAFLVDVDDLSLTLNDLTEISRVDLDHLGPVVVASFGLDDSMCGGKSSYIVGELSVVLDVGDLACGIDHLGVDNNEVIIASLIAFVEHANQLRTIILETRCLRAKCIIQFLGPIVLRRVFIEITLSQIEGPCLFL